MKFFPVIALVLTITGCTSSSNEMNTGKVVSCREISIEDKWVGGPMIDCLDGTGGVQLMALRGPMVINVWGSWCAPCEEEIPFFRSFYEKAKGKIELVGVDVEEAKVQDGREFAISHGITWPNLIDTQGNSREYFGMGVPVTWFIDSGGKPAFKKIGVIKSEDELIGLTEKYLGVKI
jgi:thiol-disulfide isomerase/thioredoxin